MSFSPLLPSQQGSARRKKKVVHRTATADDKKLQFSLKKLGVNNISGIEEVATLSPSAHDLFWSLTGSDRVAVAFWTITSCRWCSPCRSTCSQTRER